MRNIKMACTEENEAIRVLSDVTELRTKEDVATLLDAYDNYIKDNRWDKIKRVVEDKEGYYYFIIGDGTEKPNDFSLYDFIKEKWTGQEDIDNICFINCRYLVGKGRGVGNYFENIRQRGTFDAALWDEESNIGKIKAGMRTEMQDIVCILVQKSSGERLHLKEESKEYILGRSRNRSDFTIEGNLNISRTHACVYKERGEVFIKDLNSANGVYVNGRKIDADRDCRLVHGDNVLIADEKFLVSIK